MDALKIGKYIQSLRKESGMTQKDLSEKLGITFQAVSKWENGESLPDTGLLLELCDLLNTTVEKLLNAGNVVMNNRKVMHVEDVITGFENLESIGTLFGQNCDFYTGMVEGINKKMNIDLLEYLKHPNTREVMWAEVLVQGILSGRTIDMDEVRKNFTNPKMIAEIEKYIEKTKENI